MAGGENLDVVLEFLRKNGFSESEAALRNELSKVNREELIVKEIGADESNPHPWNYNPTYDPEHPRAWGDSASSTSYESKRYREKKRVSSSSNVRRDFGSFDAPGLPPVKLKSGGASSIDDGHGSGARVSSSASGYLLGSFPDVPVPEGKEVSSSGGKRTLGNSCLSVSRGIAEDTSDLVSGLATPGDEAVDYLNEYWDSDEYDDDDDVGYWRRPIEDQSWFLAHEIDYPTDTEKEKGYSSIPGQQYNVSANDHFDNHHLTEEGSCFMGEQCFQAKDAAQAVHAFFDMSDRTDENKLVVRYPGQLVDAEEQNLRSVEPVIQRLLPWSNTSGNGKDLNEYHRTLPNGFCVSSDQHSSVGSYGDDINIDADIQRKIHQNLVGKSNEEDGEFFHMKDDDIICFTNYDGLEKDRKLKVELDSDKDTIPTGKGFHPLISNNEYEFSFLTPSRAEDREGPEYGQSLRSEKVNAVGCSYADDCLHDICANDMLVTRRPESFNSSPVQSTRHELTTQAVRLGNLVAPAISNYVCLERDAIKDFQDCKANNDREVDSNTTLEYEELVAVQEQLRQIECQQQEFETFDLRIVHRKNRTGFEEDKNFHVVPNSVIAGRYHVTEYLGTAAFSKAIQAHDLQTGLDVCIKIIKNNKDFFDQSLDEIKLLKFVNKNDPADKYHILRLYDCFYFREHLLIVCELLKANLYEFHKFNRESGGEVYFTMPRLQAIAIQCLESLQFLHGLGLIHCDLKPENILVKSYSRCEVKIIDFGSSCFVTDNLCSYVQSRSYRAPEVVLGLPYYNKIDIWSLGCILAELCTGNVLFQNDSLATLLARVIGIIGSIDQGMLAKGRDTHKYFSKDHMLYQKNQETNTLEYLIPKKTSLRHRLPMGDQGFIDFVAYLLEINPSRRPSASEALKHPWLHHPYEPISS